MNGQSPQSSDDEGQTYEEPDEPDRPPPPPVSRHHVPPPPPPEEQETYDDLEDVQQESSDDEPQETYDECEIKTVQQPACEFEQSVYEAEPADDEPPSPPPEPEGESMYEFMPEDKMPTPPTSPPQGRSAPAPPPSVPSLPARPPPSRPVERDASPDSAPELPPGRPPPSPGTNKIIKKISGDGPQMLGISLGELGAKKALLKKVSSVPENEQVPEEPKPAVAGDASSVKDRINMFKQVEKVKPSEVKSPPPPVKSPTQSYKPPPQQNSFEECDDIYDEGMSYVPDPLQREEWYHGEIERDQSNDKLYSIGQDGTFLVRKSTKGGDNQPYTLVVLYEGHVYNLKMRRRKDGQIALGEEKPDELAFKDVPSLVQHHRSNDVILVNVKQNKQHKTLLKKHPIALR